jgi:hypothetical protein
MPSVTGNTEMEDRMMAYEVADLPLSLLARARATGAATDDDLLLLYLQRERAWLLDPLPVELVIPLSLTALDLDGPLVIDDSTRLEPLDAATQQARAPSDYSVAGVPNPVVSAATHAIVLSGRQLPNPGPLPRMLGRFDESLPIDDADLVCQALRILTDIDVGYAQVLLRPLGWADRWDHDLPPVTTVRTVRRYPEWFDDYAWLREPKAIGPVVLEALPDTVAALRAASARGFGACGVQPLPDRTQEVKGTTHCHRSFVPAVTVSADPLPPGLRFRCHPSCTAHHRHRLERTTATLLYITRIIGGLQHGGRARSTTPTSATSSARSFPRGWAGPPELWRPRGDWDRSSASLSPVAHGRPACATTGTDARELRHDQA